MSSGFVTGVVSIVDGEGRRVDTQNADGDFAPVELQIGETLHATKSTNGSLTRVTIEVVGVDGGTADELAPMDLNLHEIDAHAVFDFMPPALVNVNDDMSITSLTRFTALSEGTPQTPTIAGGQMTLVHAAGGDKNSGFQEG